MKKKKRRIKVNFILSLVVIVLVFIMGYCIFDIVSSMMNKTPTTIEVLEVIEGYDYELNENDSPYFEELFSELKDVLESEELDEEMYATIIGQMFITDFYSLDYAVNKNDVGGTQFVYNGYQNDFISKAKATVYNYVENNIYGDREQVLPKVKNVTLDTIVETEYEFGEIANDDSAYLATYTIEYEEDLDYPTEVTLVLIHNDNKLEVAKMN